MTYHHLMEKLIKQQDDIMSEIDKLRDEGKLPEELDKAAANVLVWTAEADKDLGPGEIPQDIPDTDPLSMFSNMLFDYQDLFEGRLRDHLVLYREYAEGIFQMAHPHAK